MKLLQELFATPDIGDQIVAPAEMVNEMDGSDCILSEMSVVCFWWLGTEQEDWALG